MPMTDKCLDAFRASTLRKVLGDERFQEHEAARIPDAEEVEEVSPREFLEEASGMIAALDEEFAEGVVPATDTEGTAPEAKTIRELREDAASKNLSLAARMRGLLDKGIRQWENTKKRMSPRDMESMVKVMRHLETKPVNVGEGEGQSWALMLEEASKAKKKAEILRGAKE